ncbi:GNAT family N-acetyltransferase [uncultured Roseobacter sp.]|uniref:GNAT family N-acetyltransferase n=1 Tax=uncultured Roseobacter sp. TaxID=114847 RepID=UPI0026339525|nr:GNAT family N-acetyltransferase [uncultured Roseobacter sp.]
MTLRFTTDHANTQDIARHLEICDQAFHPPLSSRVNLSEYAYKLTKNAIRFEAWFEHDLIGLVAIYCNATDRVSAFVSNVSVVPAFAGRGIAKQLMATCIGHARSLNFSRISLEVAPAAVAALRLYEGLGFQRETSNITPQEPIALTLRIG